MIIMAEINELGRTGVNRYGGLFYEEFLPELRGLNGVRVYEEMANNDSTVGAILFAIKNLIRQASWSVQPASKDDADILAAEFVESCLHDMQATWTDTISEILSFLTYGWSVVEIVYKRRMGRKKSSHIDSKFDDGLIGWQKLPIRAQASLYQWEYDSHDNLTAFIQMPAPSFKIIRIPIEKILLFRTESHKDNPEGRSILRNAYRCFDEDTEILTREGWKRGKELSGAEELATLNPKTKRLEYQKPTAFQKYKHTGQIYHFTSKFLDIRVTGEHRLWVDKHDGRGFDFVTAKDAKLYCEFMRYADWAAEDVATYQLKEHITRFAPYGHEQQRIEHSAKEISMDDWAAFMALYLAEGCTYQKPSGQKIVVISQKAERAEIICNLLNKLPFHYYKHKNGDMIDFELCNAQLYDELKQYGKASEKFIPQYLKETSARQLRIFLEWYQFGDGSTVGAMAQGYEGTPMIFTTSRHMADDLQEIALKAGFEAQISCDFERKHSFGKKPLYKVSLGKRRLHRAKSKKLEEYDGEVWCPTTANGIVYVRRNGKPCWIGNCWYFKKRIEEIEGIGIERDLAGFPVLTAPDGVDIWSPSNAGLLAMCNDFVSNIRRDAMEGLTIPAGWKLELLSTGGARQFDTTKIIERYDTRIAMTALADFLFLGHERTGSWALSSDKTELFSMAIGAYLDIICETFTRKAIPQLIDLNAKHFPKISGYPSLIHGDIETADLAKLGAFLKDMTGIGLISPDDELENYLREQASLPTKIEE